PQQATTLCPQPPPGKGPARHRGLTFGSVSRPGGSGAAPVAHLAACQTRGNKSLPPTAYCEYTLMMIRPLPILAAMLVPILTACNRSESPVSVPALPPEPLVLVEVAPLISLVQPLVGEGVEV